MAIKLTKRKAFNFLRSYYDVLNELKEPEDKLNFLLSIIDKQFVDEDPKDLNFIVNLCYNSQRHAVESSVKGWKRASKTTLIGEPLTDHATTPRTNPSTTLSTNPKEEEVEEKEKEKGEEEEKEEKDFDVNRFYSVDDLFKIYLENDKLCFAFISNEKNNIKSLDHLESRLKEFVTALLEVGRQKETFKEFSSYFRNWNKTVKASKEIISNPNNEKLIVFTTNANPSRQSLPESEFISYKERMIGGGYKFKIIE